MRGAMAPARGVPSCSAMAMNQSPLAASGSARRPRKARERIRKPAALGGLGQQRVEGVERGRVAVAVDRDGGALALGATGLGPGVLGPAGDRVVPGAAGR